MLVIVAFVLPGAIYFFAFKPGYLSLAIFIVMTCMCLGVSVYLAYCAISHKPDGLVGGIVVLFLAAEIFAMPALKGIVNNPKIHSIEQTRNMKQLTGIPFYYNSKDELRIEEVYAAHRNIHPINCASVDSLRSSLPFAILTHGSVASELPAAIFNYADTLHIDRYDNNNHPEGNRLHRPIFVYNVTLLTPKMAQKDTTARDTTSL